MPDGGLEMNLDWKLMISRKHDQEYAGKGRIPDPITRLYRE